MHNLPEDQAMKKQPSPFKPILDILAGWFQWLYTVILQYTCPLTVEGWEHVEAVIAAGRPVILAAWHGQVHYFPPTYASRYDLKDVHLPIVGDARLGSLGHFARFTGVNGLPVLRKDKSMTTARSLKEIIRQLVPGKFSYISPDGPDGPARVAKPGVAYIARGSNGLIVPMSSASRYARHVNRWDDYWLPLPFDRIYTVFGAPIEVPQGSARAEVLTELAEAINETQERASELARHFR